MSGRDRNVNEVTVAASYTVPIDMDYVFCEGMSGNIMITLRRTKDKLIRSHRVQNTDGAAIVTVTDGVSLSYPLSAAGEAAVFEIDKDGDFHVFAANALGASGGLAIPAGGSVSYSATPYAGTGSFQPVGPDLNLAAAAGSSVDSKYIASGMFNVIGDTLTKTKTYIAAVIGKFSVIGSKLSSYPWGAVVGEIGDGVTGADAAFVGVVGGDSAQTNADAILGVDNQNSTPGSGVNWVVNGAKASHDGYPAFAPLKGFAQVALNAGGLPVAIYFGVATNDAGIVAQVGADATIGDGSLYISHLDNAGKLFQKQNDVWIDLQA